jgi:hypothetical protein
MKKIFILFVLILNSCTPTEIEEPKPTVKTCYVVQAVGNSNDGDFLRLIVNGSLMTFKVQDYRKYILHRYCGDLKDIK